jgi:hypothetical protein
MSKRQYQLNRLVLACLLSPPVYRPAPQIAAQEMSQRVGAVGWLAAPDRGRVLFCLKVVAFGLGVR